jgi:LmbE family N-acetylglucosaminyl deacetylase
MENKSSRRVFVRQAAAGLGLLPLGSLLDKKKLPLDQPMHIVCLGGHPDDPESGCGGTLARFQAAGHQVTIIYLTRGEAGIAGKSFSEAAGIRTEEAQAACAILKAKPLFAGQIDGNTVVNNEWVAKIMDFLAEENPSLVFTHWPLDSHKDHQVASLLAIQAWIRTKNPFELYFFEVCTGEQTQGFKPTDYVDISPEQERKRNAVYCHKSQDPPGIYQCGHAAMEDFRGRESGFRAAEAFVRMTGKQRGNAWGL